MPPLYIVFSTRYVKRLTQLFFFNDQYIETVNDKYCRIEPLEKNFFSKQNIYIYYSKNLFAFKGHP